MIQTLFKLVNFKIIKCSFSVNFTISKYPLLCNFQILVVIYSTKHDSLIRPNTQICPLYIFFYILFSDIYKISIILMQLDISGENVRQYLTPVSLATRRVIFPLTSSNSVMCSIVMVSNKSQKMNIMRVGQSTLMAVNKSKYYLSLEI